jgi:hypothetical protein
VLVKKRDHRVDQKAVQPFIDSHGYSHTELYIVDRYFKEALYNKNRWELKYPIWKDN